jgi:uncharacterized protein YoxC
MIEIILGIGVAAFIVYAAFSITYIMSMKRTSDSMREFLKNTEGNLNATLSEFKGTLENMRKISGDVKEVTGDVRQISHTVASLEKGIRDIVVYLKEGLGSAAEANIAGLKAGISTGVATLIKNLQEGRRDDHEREP